MYYNSISSVLKQVAADFDEASYAIMSSQDEISVLKNRINELEERTNELEEHSIINTCDINEIKNNIELKEKINKEKIIDIINILMRD